MYSRYDRCCMKCQNTSDTLETVCSDIGEATEYDIYSNCNNNSYYDNSCRNNMDNCGCGFDSEINLFPSNPMLAQSYVPIQYMDKTFTPCCGLKNGTIFPELVSPYEPCQSMKEIAYLRARNEIGEGCNG